MICAACHQEVSDTGLGTALPHRFQGSQEFCPGFVATVSPDLAPKATPGRKVRSDKGTKRGQRTKGGDAHAALRGVQAAPGGPPSQPERVAPLYRGLFAPSGDHITPQLPEAEAVETAPKNTTQADLDPEASRAKPKRKPLYLVLPCAPPSYTDYDEACSKAEEQAEQDPGRSPYLVWEARPVDSFEQGVQRTRLGRVRKTKP